MLTKRRFGELFPGDIFLWDDNNLVLRCLKTRPQIIGERTVSNAMRLGKPVFVSDDDEVDLIIP